MLEDMKLDKVKGLTCMVDGTVPPSAGLSSSSALVCCSALLTMHANGHSLSKVIFLTVLFAMSAAI